MKRRLMVGILAGAAVVATAVGGARFSPANAEIRPWYDTLDKPPFQPPDWLFGPVWTLLYILMVASVVRASGRAEGKQRTTILTLWWAQLALNAAWTPLFFGARRTGLALLDLAGLLALLVAYTVVTARSDKPAAWFFAPYVAWVTFAGALNAEILRRNG